MLTDVSEVRTSSIIRAIAKMMTEIRTSDTSVNFNVAARRYIPEESKLSIDVRTVNPYIEENGGLRMIF
jgi:hypothetical protein